MSDRLNACVVETYTDRNGVAKTHFTPVGVAFKHKNGPGWDIILRQNLSVSGRLVLLDAKKRDSESAAPGAASDDNYWPDDFK